MGGTARRTLFAWPFNDVNVLLWSYITDHSRIMIRRNIQERVRTIAPSLRLDHDPYLVISDGRLFWMQDAYTTSDYFPYAQPAQGLNLNYIRNSVKVVVDAYHGTVDFYLMDSVDPSRRDNMLAWLAARCDPPDYGKLIVYEFPKEKLVSGPFQIEARINQNTEISQQLTLWNQMGSRVIRGANLLVIPIENSILYVSPLYLRAQQGHLPELKRVIAAYGEHVVMKETLAEALAALFVEPGAAPAVSGTTEEMPLTSPAARQARQALDRYNQAVERLKSGDWKGFGTQFDAMRELLEEMNRQSSGH